MPTHNMQPIVNSIYALDSIGLYYDSLQTFGISGLWFDGAGDYTIAYHFTSPTSFIRYKKLTSVTQDSTNWSKEDWLNLEKAEPQLAYNFTTIPDPSANALFNTLYGRLKPITKIADTTTITEYGIKKIHFGTNMANTEIELFVIEVGDEVIVDGGITKKNQEIQKHLRIY